MLEKKLQFGVGITSKKSTTNNMKLIKGLKFMQDNSLHCEVLELYSDKVRTSKKIVSDNMISIKKNNKVFNYNLTCFQKSFDTGLAFGSFKMTL